MAFKRALVVDDSATARQSLARLLAKYDLEVVFAETGEGALEFLQHELVDVIFMDHTMPGMDGLEAVSAIKANPRTAMIPVMMYTTKEGEVYVGQARALGAVGVLPKQVQPGVLYEMLNKLGLVGERRRGESDGDSPRRRLTDLAEEVDREYEQRAQSVSLQTVITRLLEAQHQRLRADILSGQRQVARQVLEEVLAHRPAQTGAAAAEPDRRRAAARDRWPAVTAVLAAMLIAAGAFAWQAAADRDSARRQVAELAADRDQAVGALRQRNVRLEAAVRDHDGLASARGRAALEALEWALDQNLLVPFEALPFDDAAADRLAELLDKLAALDFRGRVVLTAELAPFCLTTDASGIPALAEPTLPLDGCEWLGHPLESSDSVAALQSPAFAAVLDDVADDGSVTVTLAVRRAALPAAAELDADDAGTWNHAAAAANRIRVTFQPESKPAPANVAARR
ncbi:MAG TPA: response regulator [Pseudomonadales bacterium]